MLFIAFLALSEPAFAQEFGKIDDALQKIVKALTGKIATIAVAGIGLAWIACYVEMRKAFFVCVGIGIVMGASQIVSMLSH